MSNVQNLLCLLFIILFKSKKAERNKHMLRNDNNEYLIRLLLCLYFKLFLKKSPIWGHAKKIAYFCCSQPWGQDSCNLFTMGPGFLQSLYHGARIPATSLNRFLFKEFWVKDYVYTLDCRKPRRKIYRGSDICKWSLFVS